MSTVPAGFSNSRTPSTAEIAIAAASGEQLARLLSPQAEATASLQIQSAAGSEAMPIPVAAVELLRDALRELGQGHAVAVVPLHTELTTYQAAELLNVSRPYLISLLERGEIPFHKVGTHRRVAFKDLMDYKHKTRSQRLQALEELSALDQELGLGY